MPATVIRFSVDLDHTTVEQVSSFGIANGVSCNCGRCPQKLMLALGVNGEIDTPVMISLEADHAEDFIARLQASLSQLRNRVLN